MANTNIDVKGREGRSARGEGRGEMQRPGASEVQRGGGGWGGGWTSRRSPSVFSLRPTDFWSMSPWELMRRFSEDVDRVFQGTAGAGGSEALAFAPPVEVARRGNDLVVRAELPGVKPEDVRVELTDEGLVIEGERRRDFEDQGEGYYRSEHLYGRFRRTIPVPAEVTEAEAKATFKDGMLEVSIPMPESRRRQIPIEGSRGAAAGTSGSTGTSGAGSSGATGTSGHSGRSGNTR